MTTYYEILGVSPNASQQQIKNAYRELVKRYHPDRNPNSAEATKQTQLINEAYAILSDPVKRYEYDNLQQLRREPEPAAQQQTYTRSLSE
jgi:curved DNA-binding protein CbpA